MSRLHKRFSVAAIFLLASFVFYRWNHDAPRRHSLAALVVMNSALNSSNPSSVFDSLILPTALQNRTPPEKIEFLRKALLDEISSEGITALKQDGVFGLLSQVFPKDAGVWTKQAGVNVEDCVAFKMEREGIRAEVVLVHEGHTYRVMRCNNVKQMATGAHRL